MWASVWKEEKLTEKSENLFNSIIVFDMQHSVYEFTHSQVLEKTWKTRLCVDQCGHKKERKKKKPQHGPTIFGCVTSYEDKPGKWTHIPQFMYSSTGKLKNSLDSLPPVESVKFRSVDQCACLALCSLLGLIYICKRPHKSHKSVHDPQRIVQLANIARDSKYKHTRKSFS